MSENNNLEKDIKELKKAVETLIELQKIQLQGQLQKKDEKAEPESSMSKEEIEAELREHSLGELVHFALKHDLIKRGKP